MKRVLHLAVVVISAALLTGLLASIVQTQVNLLELTRLGVPVPLATRLYVTLEDALRFSPVMSALASAGLLPAVAAAQRVGRTWRPGIRLALFALAAALGLCAVFLVLPLFMPMASLVSATRTGAGLLSMCLAALPAGLLCGRFMRGPRRAHGAVGDAPSGAAAWPLAAAFFVLLAVPVGLFFAMSPKRADAIPNADAARIDVQTVATGLRRPWSVAFLPDGRRLVTEIEGRLRAVATDGAITDIAMTGFPPIHHAGGVAGLMEVALDPDFGNNAILYLTTSYGETSANGTRLVRARLNGDRLEDVRILFSSSLKSDDGNNGGRLAFLPDGSVLLTVGDGSSRREEAQSLASHQGKVIRVDREGRAPADNPFTGRAGAAAEIFSLGHRNPQGIAVASGSGEVLVSDHGPRGGDEVNIVGAGTNHGWPILTGGIDYSFARVTPFRRLAGFEDATLEWTPSIAPAGLAIYEGDLFPGWKGSLLVPALKERSIRRLVRQDGRVVGQELLLADLKTRMRDVKVAPDGSVYVLTDGIDARLLRLVPRPG